MRSFHLHARRSHLTWPAACVLSVSLAMLVRGVVRAENWPRWRGPDGNAVSQQTTLPIHWSPTQNIRWSTEIPGQGFSSPIVWGDHIFLTSAFDGGARRAAHCLDGANGKILWIPEI